MEVDGGQKCTVLDGVADTGPADQQPALPVHHPVDAGGKLAPGRRIRRAGQVQVDARHRDALAEILKTVAHGSSRTP